jgi:hypothetical protein
MTSFDLHRRIPLIRRPFYQRDQTIKERDAANAQLVEIYRLPKPAASLPMVANEPSPALS